MLKELFKKIKPVVAAIHVGALPGTPSARMSVAEIAALAVREANLYSSGGVDAVIIENMHDVPYLKGSVGPEIVAAMAVIGQALKAEINLPVGVQILAGANLEAMAVAHAASLDFVRVEGYAFAHVADEGWIESSAATLLRYRKQIGAERVEVWADVKKKHSSHTITSDITLGAAAAAAEFMRADAVIVSGSVTGEPPRLEHVEEAKAHCSLPVILGSGVDASNIQRFYSAADGFIIGTYFKRDGVWTNSVDELRVRNLMDAVNELRNSA